ncbi:MAG: hypothetical protein LBR74_05360 [Eubacterium sp.]|jgi:hypothetical protein|nr:hypothetical protein [Eubacterium sp.]
MRYKPKKNKPDDNLPKERIFSEISSAALASECTGLLSAPPQSDDEFENYQDLVGMGITKKKTDDK